MYCMLVVVARNTGLLVVIIFLSLGVTNVWGQCQTVGCNATLNAANNIVDGQADGSTIYLT